MSPDSLQIVATAVVIVASMVLGAGIAAATIALNVRPPSLPLLATLLTVAVSLVLTVLRGDIPSHPLVLLLIPVWLVGITVGFRITMDRRQKVRGLLKKVEKFLDFD